MSLYIRPRTTVEVCDTHLQPLPVSESLCWSLTVSAAPSHLLCDRGRVTVVHNSLSWSLEESIRVSTRPRTSVEVCDTHFQSLPLSDRLCWSLTVSAAPSHLLCDRGRVTVVHNSLSWSLEESIYEFLLLKERPSRSVTPIFNLSRSLTVSAAQSHLLCDRGRVTVVNSSLSWSLEESIRVSSLPRTSVEVCDTHHQPLPVSDSLCWSLTVSATSSHLLTDRGCMCNGSA